MFIGRGATSRRRSRAPARILRVEIRREGCENFITFTGRCGCVLVSQSQPASSRCHERDPSMTAPSVTPSQVRCALLLRDEIALLDLRHEAAYATGHPLFAANKRPTG